MPFDDAWLNVDRAKEHATNLHTAIQAFWESKPYGVRKHVDGERMRWSVTARSGLRVPGELSLLAGDTAHTLRSALDHLAYEAVGEPTHTTYFPIWRSPKTPSAKQLASLVRNKLMGAPRPIIDAVSQYSPIPAASISFFGSFGPVRAFSQVRLGFRLSLFRALVHLLRRNVDQVWTRAGCRSFAVEMFSGPPPLAHVRELMPRH